MWIAPYVEPQKKYTLANANSTIVDFGMRENIYLQDNGIPLPFL
jgi:hypothetical protein